MCGGVLYQTPDGETIRVYFPNPKATLPVRKKDGSSMQLPWGRRREQSGQLPLGGWARLDSIYAGRWDRYFPKSVKLPIVQFMEKDISGSSHWFDIVKGRFIQGLIASLDQERRVYVVTITPEFDQAVHDRWPRII